MEELFCDWIFEFDELVPDWFFDELFDWLFDVLVGLFYWFEEFLFSDTVVLGYTFLNETSLKMKVYKSAIISPW